MRHLIDRLEKERRLEKEEWTALISAGADREYLFERADLARKKYYGRKVFTRGLIEFTNYCKNNCYYCGIRRDNRRVKRYRLTETEILDCCRQGYALGFRTFVLQGGEDGYFTDERLTRLIRMIKEGYPDCAVTLSVGEKPKESYLRFYEAGADRYLLRHETADETHYRRLHPGDRVPVLVTGDRLSGGLRFYGRLAGTDGRMLGGGYDVYYRTGSADGGNRTVYPAS